LPSRKKKMSSVGTLTALPVGASPKINPAMCRDASRPRDDDLAEHLGLVHADLDVRQRGHRLVDDGGHLRRRGVCSPVGVRVVEHLNETLRAAVVPAGLPAAAMAPSDSPMAAHAPSFALACLSAHRKSLDMTFTKSVLVFVAVSGFDGQHDWTRALNGRG
jgi:hypothetical protein